MGVLETCGHRFFSITSHLGVQLGAVFQGDAARTVREELEWDDAFRYGESPRTRGDKRYDDTEKIYFQPVGDEVGTQCFTLGEFLEKTRELGAVPQNFEWTFIRIPGTKALCMRESEIEDFERQGFDAAKHAIWGFGRKHPYSSGFKIHQSLAGPLSDFIPGQVPAKFGPGWSFEPVLIKARFGLDKIYMVQVGSEWTDQEAIFWARELHDPQGLPAAFLNARL